MSVKFRGKKINHLSASHALTLCVLGLFGMSASAQTTSDAQAKPNASLEKVFVPQLKVGEATRRLLELQARGTMASERQYPVPVAVAEKVYQRYLESFSHPIAEKSGSTLDKLN